MKEEAFEEDQPTRPLPRRVIQDLLREESERFREESELQHLRLREAQRDVLVARVWLRVAEARLRRLATSRT